MRFLLPLLAAGCLGATALRAQTPADTTVDNTGPAELSSTDTETTAIFHDNVVVVGNGIKLTCDYLKVVSSRKGDPAATLGQYGSFKSLVATGHVYILQGNREARCGRADVYPAEDRAVLSDHPVVNYLDSPTTITGLRIVINRGKRNVVVETDAAHPAHATLPALKNLGFENPGLGATPPAAPDAK
jgi:lipopolysaccharide export system protein LptA